MRDATRFMKRVREAACGCWEWTGAKTDRGYGSFPLGRKTMGAHRASYLLFVGDIPPGLDVCHHCDNRACVRPDHLFVGTRSDNMQDCIAKGRFVVTPQRGEKHGSAKLTERDVREIRERVASVARRDLANAYGVTVETINDIVTRRTWRHVA